MLASAHATLVTGCDFVARRPSLPDVSCPWKHGVHDRMTANQLRELDRFLCVLLEEAAALLSGPDHDAARFARLRKTAEKLHIVEGMIGMPSDHGRRLAAIRRIAARLRQPCPTPQARDIALACGTALELPLALQSIARFYRDLGDHLMKNIMARNKILEFSGACPQVESAIVACGGI